MIQNVNVILASGSPRRKELFERAGIDFKVIVSDIEETSDKTLPEELVKDLSESKACAVLKSLREEHFADLLPYRGSIIVSADTVVARDDRVLGKPDDEKDALNMLMSLSGRAHKVYTGVCVLYIPPSHPVFSSSPYTDSDLLSDRISFVEETAVNMTAFSEDDAKGYIKTGEPMDKAGSYGIQGLGGFFVSGIEGDYNNVVGFPMTAFLRKCCERGYFSLY